MKKTLRSFTIIALIISMLYTTCMPVSVEAKSVKLNKTNTTLKVGKTVQLKVNNFSASKVTWKSSNTKIATVSKKGLVKAKKVGYARITAKCKGLSKKLQCVIKIVKPVIKLEVNTKIITTTQATTKATTTTQATTTTETTTSEATFDDVVEYIKDNGQVTNNGDMYLLSKYEYKKYDASGNPEDGNYTLYYQITYREASGDLCLNYYISMDTHMNNPRVTAHIYKNQDRVKLEFEWDVTISTKNLIFKGTGYTNKRALTKDTEFTYDTKCINANNSTDTSDLAQTYTKNCFIFNDYLLIHNGFSLKNLGFTKYE